MRRMATTNICFVFLLVLSIAGQCKTRRVSKPHILFLLVDDLGWSDVGFHGSKIQTPNIDRLAEEGVILDNYYVQPLCTPTRSSLLTGRYPIHTGLQVLGVWPDKPFGMPLEFRTLPKELKEVGYATHAVGKWHLGFFQSPYLPTNRGFNSFYGLLNGGADHYTHRAGGIPDLHNNTTPVTDKEGVHSTFIFTERAVEIVQRHNPSKPLFIYMAYQSNHDPLQAPKTYTDKYSFMTNEHRRKYAAMMDMVDESIGNITSAFKKAGLWSNTLTIFSTDNGGRPSAGGYNWPLRGHKNTLWEGGVRGVAFIHGGMLGRQGVKCKELIHVTDWYPTLLNLTGATYSNTAIPVDGLDVWSTLSTGAPSPRKEILHNIDPHHTNPEGTGRAIRVGDMKLVVGIRRYSWPKPPELDGLEEIHQKGRITALYNITADPEERNDLSATFPELMKKLELKLKAYEATVVKSLFEATKRDQRAWKEATKKRSWGPWLSDETNTFEGN